MVGKMAGCVVVNSCECDCWTVLVGGVFVVVVWGREGATGV